MENKFITIKEAAKMLGVSVLTLRNWDNSGKFTAGRHPISNYRVYKISDIENLISKISDLPIARRNSPRRDVSVRKLNVKHLND